MSFHCRTATLPELEQILDWAAEEGWNPGLDDAPAFFAADPEGFFVAVGPDDQPVAAISVVNHSADFAFLGLYIVRPAYRGQGIGLALWTHALKHAGPRTVGLDGVEAQQDNYRASGFAHAGGTTRYSGEIAARSDTEICEINAEDIPALIAMEAAASGSEKPDYLRVWLTASPNRRTLALSQTGRVTGFCTVRACRTGAKIGPLIAANAADAERLIGHAACLYSGPIILDVPQSAQALDALCQTLGLGAGFRTARMYRGPFDAPQPPVFAVASLELG
ncbi:GNAT family N-acetyltransferase [Pacificoceanicola onchidii]|uniref:GNAT family N-acetyltransferase n=1 Tax=Pacificoceanicola onchidii TaxID=2562685 RepID=UPI0010A61808|nr:GNAT family N-acetyltransferase [Pacificoceanicola onchidii]